MQLVCTRLALRGIKSIVHASNGQPLKSLAADELQDMEDLEVRRRKRLPCHPPHSAQVEEATELSRALANGHTGFSRRGFPCVSRFVFFTRRNSPTSGAAPGRIERAASTRKAPLGVRLDVAGGEGDADDEDKYTVRRHAGKLAKLLAQAGLGGGSASPSHAGKPLLGEPAGPGARRRRRKASAFADPRVLLLAIALLSCAGTMLLLYRRLGAAAGPAEDTVPAES